MSQSSRVLRRANAEGAVGEGEKRSTAVAMARRHQISFKGNLLIDSVQPLPGYSTDPGPHMHSQCLVNKLVDLHYPCPPCFPRVLQITVMLTQVSVLII